MEESGNVVLILSAITLSISWLLLWVTKTSRAGLSPLPPGPLGLPLISSLMFLEHNLHCHFAELSKVYGPIMKTRLGNMLCIVLGSSSITNEVLKDHDTTFANHDPTVAALAVSYGGMDIVWAPYGLQWRMLSKVCIHQLMSNNFLDACSALRQREVRKMVADINAKTDETINVGEQIYAAILNVITGMLWGDMVIGEEFSCTGAKFRCVLDEIVEIFRKPNVSDFFPILARFDIRGLARQMKRCMLLADQILDAILDRNQKEGTSKESKDFLKFLLWPMEQGDPKMELISRPCS